MEADQSLTIRVCDCMTGKVDLVATHVPVWTLDSPPTRLHRWWLICGKKSRLTKAFTLRFTAEPASRRTTLAVRRESRSREGSGHRRVPLRAKLPVGARLAREEALKITAASSSRHRATHIAFLTREVAIEGFDARLGQVGGAQAVDQRIHTATRHRRGRKTHTRHHETPPSCVAH